MLNIKSKTFYNFTLFNHNKILHAKVSICIFTGANVMILNRKILKFEIDLDFVLIAVTSSLKDYRICYLINKCVNFNFLKTDDLAVEISPDGPVYFSMYTYHWEESATDFFFIANKG